MNFGEIKREGGERGKRYVSVNPFAGVLSPVLELVGADSSGSHRLVDGVLCGIYIGLDGFFETIPPIHLVLHRLGHNYEGSAWAGYLELECVFIFF